MPKFHVSGGYQTESGNIGAFAFVFDAEDFDDAMNKAERLIKADRRRKYFGKLDMSASQYPVT